MSDDGMGGVDGTLETRDNVMRSPRGEAVRGGSYSCTPSGTVKGKTKICHLLAGIIPSVNGEMIFVPTEDESFIRGLSQR